MIETIQGVNTRDMPLAYAEMMLRGDPGTSVELGVLRFRNPEPTKMAIVRSPVVWPSVSNKMLSDGIGMVQVPTLEANRLAEVGAAIRTLTTQGAKKLILDLRNCATGDPEQGIALANLFLDNGNIGYAMGQRSPRQDFKADPAKAMTKLPLVIMTNRGTAGPAEIATAALLDHKRAEVVGERTYGDAAIRKPIVMDDGAAVILSVAKFYNVGEKALQDVGVTPTVAVAGSEPADIVDDDEQTPAAPKKEEKPSGEDPILKKAIEISQKGLTADESKAAEAVRNAARKQDDKKSDSSLGPLNIPKPE
jgi:carboxyl-terminal processing protease